MEIPRPPPSSQGAGGRLPSIYIGDNCPSRPFGNASQSPHSSSFSPSLASIPMSIPHAADQLRAPPPLPPPRVVPVNGPMSAAAEEYRRREQLEPVDEHTGYRLRLDRDEGYHSMESRSRDSLGSSKFGPHQGPLQFRPSSDAYDNSLLSKLDIRGTFDNRSPPRHHGNSSGGGLSTSVRDLRPVDRLPVLQLLSLPTRVKHHQQYGVQPLDPPNRSTETSLHSATSPRSAQFSNGNSPAEYRSPNDASGDYDRSPSIRTWRTNSESPPDEAGHHEQVGDDDSSFTMDEANRLRDFHLDSGSISLQHQAQAYLYTTDCHTAAKKRRASSPPGGDEPPLPLYSMTSSEHIRWREGRISRRSPTPRLGAQVQESIASSASSMGRTGSYSSSLSLATTSGSNALSTPSINGLPILGTLEHQSPKKGITPADPLFSPAACTKTTAEPPKSAVSSPYESSATLIPPTVSPRSAAPRRSMASPTNHDQHIPDIANATGQFKRSDFFMCDCCPKKPRRFDTEEQLRAHEMEKQYECQYCGNRFKNKNEAERHQNSLHLRRHSWSCAALSSYDRAFHESTYRPGEADSCGYCGQEFVRSGISSVSAARHPTDQDWDDRIRHLQDVHKFRECNASKKFFRADHFRQHLKHSHAGTSGKWTNMLENACMLEEEPLPLR